LASTCVGKVLGSPDAQIVQTQELKLNQPLLLCCFPSAGVVGIIVANEIVEQFKMEEIAFVRSKYVPSAAVFLDGRLRHPFRIYANKTKNLIVVTTELPIAEEGMYAVSSSLLDWAATMGVKETVVLDGIPVQGLPEERKVLFVAEEEKIAELQKFKDMEMLNKGIITGIAGSVLAETLCRSVVGFALLTPAIAVVPDPEAAIQLIQALNKLYRLGIDFKDLQESADEVRKHMEQVAQQVEGMRKTPAQHGVPGYERMYA
jgi:uncharacterized protein